MKTNPSLINRAQVRKLALHMAKERAHEFTRCGASFLDRIEARVRGVVAAEVRALPSKGRTML